MSEVLHFVIAVMVSLTLAGRGNEIIEPLLPDGTAYGYLAEVMDQFHRTYDVYTDSDAAGNHFFVRGRMSSPGDEETDAWMLSVAFSPDGALLASGSVDGTVRL